MSGAFDSGTKFTDVGCEDSDEEDEEDKDMFPDEDVEESDG